MGISLIMGTGVAISKFNKGGRDNKLNRSREGDGRGSDRELKIATKRGQQFGNREQSMGRGK